MQHRQYPPHPALADYVKCLWTAERDARPPEDAFDLLPDSFIELVFTVGGRCQIDDGQQVRALPRCCLIGLLDHPLRVRTHGVVRTVAARFFAWGFSALFPLQGGHPRPWIPFGPADASDPTDPAGRDAAWHALADRIADAVQRGEEMAAVDHLQTFLLQQVLHGPSDQGDPGGVRAAARLLLECQGHVKITDLSARVSYSARQLERTFARSVGEPPKALARRLRFERARDHLAREPEAALAALAQACGYADQAHFARDFKRFSGKTPTAFAQEMRALRTRMRDHYYVVFLQA